MSYPVYCSSAYGIQNFEEWGKLVGAATAQALDLFPLLRRLPEVMLPSLVQAKILAKKELKMYMGNFTKTKERISSGISHVSPFLQVIENNDD